MTPIRAVVHDRRIELTAPDDLPDGTEVLIDLTPLPPGKIGLSEAEWRDDADALADWAAWLETIEPLAFASDERRSCPLRGHDNDSRAFRQFHRGIERAYQAILYHARHGNGPATTAEMSLHRRWGRFWG
jgi:hypothetical protein